MEEKNYKIEDFKKIAEEAKRAAEDSKRTMNSIEDPIVKEILEDEYTFANSQGTNNGKGIIGAIGGGALAGGVLTGGAAMAGNVGIGEAVFLATGTGAAAGSAVPIIGTVAGAFVGFALALAFYHSGNKKSNQEKEKIIMELRTALEKEDRYIRQLQKEKEELIKELEVSHEQKERLKYIVSILSVCNGIVPATN